MTTSVVGVDGVEVWGSEVMERLDAGEMAFDDLKGICEGCGGMGSEMPFSLLPPGLSPLCNGSEGINLIRLHPPSHPPPSQCVALPPSPPPSAPLAALLDGSEGFDMTRGVWRKTGWKELKDLRKVCGVGQRGRGGGGRDSERKRERVRKEVREKERERERERERETEKRETEIERK